MTERLVLASGSPRRFELMAGLGLAFELRPADLDESLLPGEPGTVYVERLAREKAARWPAPTNSSWPPTPPSTSTATCSASRSTTTTPGGCSAACRAVPTTCTPACASTAQPAGRDGPWCAARS